MKTPTKSEIVALLRAFVAQRSGIDWRNYSTRESFMADYRRILRAGRDARTLLCAVEQREGITAEDLLPAFRHRLTLETRADGTHELRYVAGQYFPTEYREAVCSALAGVLWDHVRRVNTRLAASNEGDQVRRYFRTVYGRGIQKRWFD